MTSPIITAQNSLILAQQQLTQFQQDFDTQFRSMQDLVKQAMSTSFASILEAIEALKVTTIIVNATGRIDVTKAIQAYLDLAGNLYLPAGDYLIDALTMLRIRSNTKLSMDPDARLLVIPNDQPSYRVLDASGVQNVKLSGVRVIGDRDVHTYTLYPDIKKADGTTVPNPKNTHEHGHGLGIYGSVNVIAEDMHFSELTGDGVCVGPDTSGKQWVRSSNIDLVNLTSLRNRRQGLSLTNVDGVRVLGGSYSETGKDNGISTGTSPRCGIDIEPNDDAREDGTGQTEAAFATNILLEGVTVRDNAWGINVQNRCLNLVLRKCNISDNKSIGMGLIKVDGFELDGNTFARNGGVGVQVSDGAKNGKIHDQEFVLNSQGAKVKPVPRTAPERISGAPKSVQRDLKVNPDAVGINVGENVYG